MPGHENKYTLKEDHNLIVSYYLHMNPCTARYKDICYAMVHYDTSCWIQIMQIPCYKNKQLHQPRQQTECWAFQKRIIFIRDISKRLVVSLRQRVHGNIRHSPYHLIVCHLLFVLKDYTCTECNVRWPLIELSSWLTMAMYMENSKSKWSKVAFIILSPSAIEASRNGLMRQFELYAIITPTYVYSAHIHCCMQSEW